MVRAFPKMLGKLRRSHKAVLVRHWWRRFWTDVHAPKMKFGVRLYRRRGEDIPTAVSRELHTLLPTPLGCFPPDERSCCSR
jgi:hypothetical protein